MAQIAASMEYEAASPPDGPTWQTLLGASLLFLLIKAIDGFKVQAALWQPWLRSFGSGFVVRSARAPVSGIMRFLGILDLQRPGLCATRTRRRREPDSNHRSRSCERLFWALPIGDGGTKGGAT